MAANDNVIKTDWSMLVEREAIGQGSFATVYKASHRRWGVVAYKLLSKRGEWVEEKVVKDLEKEVTSHCHLRHSNIVQIMAMVYDQMVECGIVLCFEKYGNIGQFLRNFEVPLAWKIELVCHINLGMNYLHTNEPPVIHGDLKTLNILVGDGFVAKISDFGMSVWKTYSSLRTQSADVHLKGTVTHIPPERLQDYTIRLHETADVYAFGILMWEILTGKHPYHGCPPAHVHTAVVNNQRPPVDQVPADVPANLKKCMTQCWSQQPENRPTTDELKTTLAAMKMDDTSISEAKLNLCQQERQLVTRVPVQCASNAASAAAVDHNPRNNRTGSAGPVQCLPTDDVVDVADAADDGDTTASGQHGDDFASQLNQMSIHSRSGSSSSVQTVPARLHPESDTRSQQSRQRMPLRNVFSCDSGTANSSTRLAETNADTSSTTA